MKYKRPICWLNSNITWLRGVPYWTVGHNYYQVYESDDCELLYCDRCWHISPGLHFNPQEKINEIKSLNQESKDGVNK